MQKNVKITKRKKNVYQKKKGVVPCVWGTAGGILGAYHCEFVTNSTHV